MPEPPPGVRELAERSAELGWVTELFVGGSAASGDHHPGVSDLDLVALTAGPVDADRRTVLARIHRALDRGPAPGSRWGAPTSTTRSSPIPPPGTRRGPTGS